LMTRFSAWKEGLLLYLPWCISGLTLLVWGKFTVLSLVGFVFLLIGLSVLLFFRDPSRHALAGELDILAPADGKVVGIETLEATPHYDGPCIRISIFLSLLDVHVNRAPFAGTVLKIIYKPGNFLDARRKETSELNESLTLVLETTHGMLAVRQIAGAIARRIVCRAAPCDFLNRGEKYGMIRFGSRTELYLPCDVEIVVKEDEKVRAGETVVARFKLNV